MIILQESGSPQTINFIPREFTSGNTYNVKITNEVTGSDVYDQDTTAITSNLYYNQFNGTFTLKQENSYTLKVSDNSGNVVFKDKIFCTNQSVNSYSVNSSEYTIHSSNNDFIII